ncbi:hypothetical protein SGUI_0576 [Serinicoccus hydrothermalis]|uniref:Uncharacterized protein n=1 Tax=Serinicoccus hydrothermalis TaxID=1758689 RepID=A0A1B1N958_9MICO|nr:hypothetical protein [Serinicoccus hydrothermalis]ANS77972.1 hypothetical protein SGUI_0576 [Serinicoccus hydrothermalis]
MSEQQGPRVIGVYNAKGGVLGEAAYVWGKARGSSHCSLCDITHATVRRKKEWEQMVAGLELRHLNELTPTQEAAVEEAGAPVVLAEGEGGGHTVLLSRADLDELGGDVTRFEQALRRRLADHTGT